MEKALKKVVEPLIALLRDEDSEVRLEATLVLKGINADREKELMVIESLIALSENKESLICRTAIEELGTMGCLNHKAINHLIALSKNGDLWIRESAVYALSGQEPEKVIERLIELLEDDSWTIREKLVWVFEKLKTQKAVKCLVELLRDKDRRVRRSAALALGKTFPQIALELFVEMIEDAHEEK